MMEWPIDLVTSPSGICRNFPVLGESKIKMKSEVHISVGSYTVTNNNDCDGVQCGVQLWSMLIVDG